MRLMGIDYGSKRVGVALSDEAGLMAFPHRVLTNNPDLLKSIEEIIAKESVTEIVIGHSIGRDGEDNKIHAATTELITDLTLAVGLPVHLQPEHYTTQEAIRFTGRNDMTDAAAAAVILNSYITKVK